jgi:hypothetical protein
MTKNLRWRFITLQGILVLVLGCAAGFLNYQSNFVKSYIHDELVSQQISFPDKATLTSAKTADGSPEYTNLVIQYAGQPVDNGDKAYAYANGFIGVHLQAVANGLTYSQVSTAAQKDPTNAKLAAQKTTLFQGETLRSMLLNAWGWSEMAKYTFYATIVMTIGAIAMFGALLFELFLVRPPVFVAQSRRAVA